MLPNYLQIQTTEKRYISASWYQVQLEYNKQSHSIESSLNPVS